MSKKSLLGILLEYPKENIILEKSIDLPKELIIKNNKTKNKLFLNFIGSGNYATKMLIPAFKKTGVELRKISANKGLAPTWYGKKYGFRFASTDSEKLIRDKKANVIVITSRHESHAKYVIKSLNEGKNVFVEKPLALMRVN